MSNCLDRNKHIVIIESPWQNGTGRNPEYARAAVRDSILRGEAPFASHLIYTQPGILDDSNPEDRDVGIATGLSFMCVADLVAVYQDLGITLGMAKGIEHAMHLGLQVEYRRLHGWR